MRHRFSPLPALQNQLGNLSKDLIDRANRSGGLDLGELIRFIADPKDFTVHCPEDLRDDQVLKLEEDETIKELGNAAIEEGKVAFCILAGGAGSRIKSTKSLLMVPGTDRSLLSIKVLNNHCKNLWVMTSPSNQNLIEDHLRSIGAKDVKTFNQFESLRLTPDNQLHLNDDGSPSFYPCGHGDLIPALESSGILKDFLESGGKYISVVNVDNIAASLDPRIIGQHIKNDSIVTVEVTKKNPGEIGGIACSHDGFPQVVENFRLSGETDTSTYRWISTNSMTFNADLKFDSIKWTWHRVKKIVDEKIVVQYERLLQDLTSNFKTSFVEVKREDRFFPIKNSADLESASKTKFVK